jgi:hypothetical protein
LEIIEAVVKVLSAMKAETEREKYIVVVCWRWKGFKRVFRSGSFTPRLSMVFRLLSSPAFRATSYIYIFNRALARRVGIITRASCDPLL